MFARDRNRAHGAADRPEDQLHSALGTRAPGDGMEHEEHLEHEGHSRAPKRSFRSPHFAASESHKIGNHVRSLSLASTIETFEEPSIGVMSPISRRL